LDSFSRRHADWLGRVPGGPLYCLPAKAIIRLGHPYLGRTAVLDGPAASAERDLLALCRPRRAGGSDGRRPIDYPYLVAPLPPPTRDAFPDLGWTAAQWRNAEEGVSRTGQVNLRLKGYAGWLATEPPFLDAAEGLGRRWRALPQALRP